MIKNLFENIMELVNLAQRNHYVDIAIHLSAAKQFTTSHFHLECNLAGIA
jgi:hypothetical protein